MTKRSGFFPIKLLFLVLAMFLSITVFISRSAFAAVDCSISDTGLYSSEADYIAAKVWCSQFTSRFDGTTDYFFLGFPPSFDKTKPVNLILWFRALGQSDGSLADTRMFNGDAASGFPGVPSLYNAILVSPGQRGTHSGDYTCSFLGDFTPSAADPEFCLRSPPNDPSLADSYRLAAKQDILEIINELASQFKIAHVFVAGASMGGYTGLRLIQLYPDIFSGAITAATALCAKSFVVDGGGPPNCTGGWVPSGTKAIYDAATSGVYNDKLIYLLLGANDDSDLLDGDRYFNNIMNGKSLYHYREIAGQGHENFFADDYNVATLGKTAWLIDNPAAAPNLQEDIQNYISTHPRSPLTPSAGWTAPASLAESYLTQHILDASGGAGFTSGGTGTTEGTASSSSGGCSLIVR